jgi:hypothetical protein
MRFETRLMCFWQALHKAEKIIKTKLNLIYLNILTLKREGVVCASDV